MAKRESGFGLLELMLASLIIMIMAGVSASLFSSSSRSMSDIGALGSCDNIATTAMNRLSGLGTRDEIVVANYLDESDPGDSIQRQQQTAMQALVTKNHVRKLASEASGMTWFNSSVMVKPPSDASLPETRRARINNALAIVNTVNLLQSLYNGNVNYCTSPTGVSILNTPIFREGIFEGGVISSGVQDVTLQIQPYNLAAGTVATGADFPSGGPCPQPLFAAPARTSAKPNPGFSQPANDPAVDSFEIIGNPDLAFTANLTVTQVDSVGRRHICSKSQVFSHQRDNVRPQAPGVVDLHSLANPLNLVDRANAASLQRMETMCNTDGAGYNSAISTWSLPSNEAGVVYLCKGFASRPSYQGNPIDPTIPPDSPIENTEFVPCSRPVFKVLGVYYKGRGFINASNRLQVEFGTNGNPTLPGDFRYQLDVIAVDTAGNASPSGSVLFNIDDTRPKVSNIYAIPDNLGGNYNLGPPEDGLGGRADVPRTPPGYLWSVPVNPATGKEEVQCNSLPVRFAAQIVGSLPSNFTSCQALSDTCRTAAQGGCFFEPTAPNTCRVWAGNAGPITHGNHSIQVFGADVCGSDPVNGSASKSWMTFTKFDVNPTADPLVISPTPDAAHPIPPGEFRFSKDVEIYNNTPPVLVGTPAWYKLTFQANAANYPLPRRWTAECDTCQTMPLYIDNAVASCGAPDNFLPAGQWGSSGCRAVPNNFVAQAYDVCGRTNSTATAAPAEVKGTYGVWGGTADQCGAPGVTCGQTSTGTWDLICSNPDPSDPTQVARCETELSPTTTCNAPPGVPDGTPTFTNCPLNHFSCTVYEAMCDTTPCGTAGYVLPGLACSCNISGVDYTGTTGAQARTLCTRLGPGLENATALACPLRNKCDAIPLGVITPPPSPTPAIAAAPPAPPCQVPSVESMQINCSGVPPSSCVSGQPCSQPADANRDCKVTFNLDNAASSTTGTYVGAPQPSGNDQSPVGGNSVSFDFGAGIIDPAEPYSALRDLQIDTGCPGTGKVAIALRADCGGANGTSCQISVSNQIPSLANPNAGARAPSSSSPGGYDPSVPPNAIPAGGTCVFDSTTGQMNCP